MKKKKTALTGPHSRNISRANLCKLFIKPLSNLHNVFKNDLQRNECTVWHDTMNINHKAKINQNTVLGQTGKFP